MAFQVTHAFMGLVTIAAIDEQESTNNKYEIERKSENAFVLADEQLPKIGKEKEKRNGAIES